MTEIEHNRSGYRISSDADAMDLDAIHAYLSGSYWAQGIPRAVVAKAISGSPCFGVFNEQDEAQVGFARVVTDRATFAYLCDVYVLEEHRGRGLAAWLIEAIVSHPDLQGRRRFVLATRDAHGLYEKFGFVPLARPEIFMEINRPGIYAAGAVGPT
jgi:GNAT superfamily N-acetyltransferase